MSNDEVEFSKLQREAEAKVREGQHGEAFIDVAKDMAAGRLPLLTTIVPHGTPSVLDRKPPAPKPTLRRKAVR